MSFRPQLRGYIHGLLLLMRTQRRFEEEMAASAPSLSNVLRTDTQQAAIELFKTLSAKLVEIGNAGPQGSNDVKVASEKLSLDIGDKAVLWRAAARADLATSESNA